MLESFEDLRRLSSSDTMLFNKLLNRLWGKSLRFLGIEEELEELAEKRVESLVLRSKAAKMRPASCEKVSDLRAEGDVVLDELFAGAQ